MKWRRWKGRKKERCHIDRMKEEAEWEISHEKQEKTRILLYLRSLRLTYDKFYKIKLKASLKLTSFRPCHSDAFFPQNKCTKKKKNNFFHLKKIAQLQLFFHWQNKILSGIRRYGSRWTVRLFRLFRLFRLSCLSLARKTPRTNSADSLYIKLIDET